MRPAGEVIRVAQGLLVIRAADQASLEIGHTLIDDQLETVGRVVDVFGPVSRPYIAVTPAEAVDPQQLLGVRLYERDAS